MKPSVQRDGRLARAPPVDAEEQEQPHHVDEVPVPGGGLEAEMLARLELAGHGAEQADQQEGRADEHMEAVEAGGHEERRRIDVVAEAERRVEVLEGLDRGEADAQDYS